MSLVKPGRTKQLTHLGHVKSGARAERSKKDCVSKGAAQIALALALFAQPECEKALSHSPISFSLYGNAFYTGYLLEEAFLRCMTTQNYICKGD